MPKEGDIVLLPIPFSDLTSKKRRPAIVISNNAYNVSSDDLLVAAMTSGASRFGISIPISTTDLEFGVLARPSNVRSDKVYSLAKSLVAAVFGRVKPDIIERIREGLLILTKP